MARLSIGALTSPELGLLWQHARMVAQELDIEPRKVLHPSELSTQFLA